jgi:DHA2 family multidrug resistance protein
MITAMMARRSQFHQATLVGHVTPLDAGYADTLHGTASTLVAQGASAADAAGQAQALVYGLVQRQALMMAVTDTFFVLSLIFVAMVPLALLIKRTAPPTGPIHMD